MNIREKIYNYFEKQPQLHVLFVFDPMGYLENDIMQGGEAWPDDYVYVKFAGDWFTTKVRLAGEWAGRKVVLLFDHHYPQPDARSQATCLAFPLLSTLRANMVFHEEDTIAFMQQRGIPAAFQPFVDRHLSELLRERYDRILAPYYDARTFSLDVAYRGILSGYLGQSRMQEWYQIIARLVILSHEAPNRADEFFYKANMVKGSLNARDTARALDDKLQSLVGLGVNPNAGVKLQAVAEAMKYNLLTGALSGDSRDPYLGLKVESAVMLQNLNSLAEQIGNDARLSAAFATALAALGAHVREEEIVAVYGTDAAYSHLTERMCKPIARSIAADTLYSAPALAAEKLARLVHSLPAGAATRTAITFLQRVALWNERRQAVATFVLNTPDDYIIQYTTTLYKLDALYREALAAYADLPADYSSERVEDVRRRLDADYAEATNQINGEWVKCVAEGGTAFRSITAVDAQATFYKKHVAGIKNKVVVVVSDALRYEMAIDLSHRLNATKHAATVEAMLAGLPTETKYCKPTLFPHATLRYADTRLLVDGRVLATTEERGRQLAAYRDDALCVDYKTLTGKGKTERREIFKHLCVYVMHNTIDEKCHGCSLTDFAHATEQALDELSQLVVKLHNEDNVRHVFVTSDHGFLYNAHHFEEKDKHQTAEPAQGEKKSRYILDAEPLRAVGLTTFPLRDASPMEGEGYVSVPTGTNRLMVKGGDYEFAHGGAALQEMIVPVLYSRYNRDNEKGHVGVALMETRLSVTSSRLKVHLVQAQAVTMDMLERTVVVALYAGGERVSAETTVTLNSTDTDMGASRIYEVTLTATDADRKIMQLRVYDAGDRLNPLIAENVVNNTLIEQDDF